jgi:tryptophan synthase alpha chain
VLDRLAAASPDVPVVLFTYLNPVLAMGAARFARAAREAGAAGMVVVDLPVGSDPETEAALRAGGVPLVRLVAPTTPPARLARIAAASEGFVYLVARLGVTGASRALAADLGARVAAVRAATTLPVAVGFGISAPEQAGEVAALADGVVVGSAVVQRMTSGGAAAALSWLGELRAAMDRARAARAAGA